MNSSEGLVQIEALEPRWLLSDSAFVTTNYAWETPSGTGTWSVYVKLSSDFSNTVTIDYRTAGGTATPGVDYISTSGKLTFAPHQTSAYFTLTIVNDSECEATESIGVELSNATGAVLDLHPGEIAVTDDDSPAFRIESAYEPNQAKQLSNLFIDLPAPATASMTLNWTTVDGTALDGVDYLASSGTVTFAKGSSYSTIPLWLLGDYQVEPSKRFAIILSNPDIGSYACPVTLADDDAAGVFYFAYSNWDPSGTVSLSCNEGDTLQVTVGRSVSSGSPADTDILVTVGGVPGVDYVPFDQVLRFTGGQTQKTFTITIPTDGFVDPGRNISLGLTPISSNGATIDIPTNVDITIGDNTWPKVTARCTGSNYEPDYVHLHNYYVVELSKPSDHEVSVDVSTNGSLVSPNIGTIVFAPGETSKALDILQDRNVNPDLYVNLCNPYYATIDPPPPAPPRNPWDDPEPPKNYGPPAAAVYWMDRAAYVGYEGRQVTVTVHRSGDLTQAGHVSYSTVGGTATAGTDYTPAAGILDFAANEDTKTFTVDIPADNVDDSGETIGLQLASPSSGTVASQSSAITILEPTKPLVWIDDAAVSEGDSGTRNLVFNVHLSQAATAPVTIQYYTVNRWPSDNASIASSYDYVPCSGSVTFDPGQTVKEIVVPVVGDDTVEADEQMGIAIKGGNDAIVADDWAVGTIITDDTAWWYDGYNRYGYEGATVSLTIKRTGSLDDRTIHIQQLDKSTAQAGVDYMVPSDVHFAAGESSKTISVQLLNDSTAEGREDIWLRLQEDTDGAAAGNGSGQTVDIVIYDPVGPSRPTVSISNAYVAESDAGAYARFVVSLSATSTVPVSVTYHTVDGTAIAGEDYQAVSGTLIFSPGQTAQEILVPIIGDHKIESDETFTLVSNPSVYNYNAPHTPTATIYNDDMAGTFRFSTTACQGYEGDQASITVTRTGGLADASVSYAVMGGSAQAGVDFSQTGGVLTFTGGETSKTFTVDLLHDDVVENDETVVLGLLAPSGGYASNAPLTLTITDGAPVADQPVVSIVASDADAAEKGLDAGTFTITRDDAAGVLTVRYTVGGTASNGSDYAALSGSVVIADGQTSATVTITPIDDPIYEGDETVVLTLSASNDYAVGDACCATVSIAESSRYLPTVSIVATDASASERSLDTGTFTISRTDSVGDLTVYYYKDGTAINGVDYSTLSDSVVIPNGQYTALLTITPIADRIGEGEETVALALSASSDYVLGIAKTATVYIEDQTVVSISATDSIASERSGDNGTFTIGRSDCVGDLTVFYSVGGTATGGTDYQRLSGSVVIANGEYGTIVTVTPFSDGLDEADETVILTLSPGSGFVLGASQATVTIASLPSVSIIASDSYASEGGWDTGAFTITRSSSLGTLTVYYSVGGTAKGGDDYYFLSSSGPTIGRVSFINGQTSATVQIKPYTDSLAEGNETVILTLSPSDDYAVGASGSSATVTITDQSVRVVAYDENASELGLDTGTFWIVRSGSAGNLFVRYTVGGTAASGADYSALSGSVNIDDGHTTAAVTIKPVADSLVEGIETVILTLSPGSDYAVDTVNIATVSIADSPRLSGDASGDGRVDFADYLILEAHFGTASGATAGAGDFNSDGRVDFNDYLALEANFGGGADAAVGQVAADTAMPQSQDSTSVEAPLTNTESARLILEPTPVPAADQSHVDALSTLPANSAQAVAPTVLSNNSQVAFIGPVLGGTGNQSVREYAQNRNSLQILLQQWSGSRAEGEPLLADALTRWEQFWSGPIRSRLH